MTIRVILALVLWASTAGTALANAPIKWADLSRDEKSFVERTAVQADQCPNEECRADLFLKIAQAVTLRRSVGAQSLSEVTSRELKRSCDQHEGALEIMLDCLRARQNLSFENGMRIAGYTKAGINSRGYEQLRIGMELDEVEYILDDFGEEKAYAASGGYSASTYQWTAGRRIIVVSFADYKLSGRSQSGLY
jgi:hypothetical protein